MSTLKPKYKENNINSIVMWQMQEVHIDKTIESNHKKVQYFSNNGHELE